jgi:hypothetical protein
VNPNLEPLWLCRQANQIPGIGPVSLRYQTHRYSEISNEPGSPPIPPVGKPKYPRKK